MKVVKRKSDGKIVYRSNPEFEEGFGIKNAIALNNLQGGNFGNPEDYEEVEITESEWIEKIVSPRIEENKIQEEVKRILREQAIVGLKIRGEL